MTRLSNLELFFISASISLSALILSFIYCQIMKVEWTITYALLVLIPLDIYGFIYISKRHKEIEYLEELENTGK